MENLLSMGGRDVEGDEEHSNGLQHVAMERSGKCMQGSLMGADKGGEECSVVQQPCTIEHAATFSSYEHTD